MDFLPERSKRSAIHFDPQSVCQSHRNQSIADKFDGKGGQQPYLEGPQGQLVILCSVRNARQKSQGAGAGVELDQLTRGLNSSPQCAVRRGSYRRIAQGANLIYLRSARRGCPA